MCVKCIDITAKSSANSAVVSLRQNELISNLRALVAVRFEQAIDIIILVFAGQVLQDGGTIDCHGIISGVTVHVVFRQKIQKEAPPMDNATASASASASGSSSSLKTRAWLLKSTDLFKPLLDDPAALRDMLQCDSRMKTLIDQNVSFRHYLNSDRNLRDLFATIFNPAKVQELSRKRDMHIMRMEWVPGGYRVLGKLNLFMRQANEDNVANTFKDKNDCNGSRHHDNPQRGRENKLPLPNPWLQQQPIETLTRQAERMVSDLQQTCNNMLKSLQKGDTKKTLEQSRALKKLAENARRVLQFRIAFRPTAASEPTEAAESVPSDSPTTPAGPPLNLFDFMSSNGSRWEQHFQSQLIQLTTLGHTDRQRNICALLMSFGDIQTAVKLLEKWNR